MLSHPWAFSGLRFFDIRYIIFFYIYRRQRLSVLYSKCGSTLELLSGVHWEEKYELKSCTFLSELEMILLFTFSGGIWVFFWLFKNVFRIDQYVFGIVEGSSNFLLNMFVYLSLASTIIFEHSFDLAVRRFLFSSVG